MYREMGMTYWLEKAAAESWAKLEALVNGLFPESAEEILPYLIIQAKDPA
jgi:hypothetical protein